MLVTYYGLAIITKRMFGLVGDSLDQVLKVTRAL